MSRHGARSVVAGTVAAVAGLAAAACGSGDVVAGRLGADGALAALDVIDLAADHRPATATAYVEAADGQPLDAGDRVRTNPDGFAEIAYADGSLTRLGNDTEVTVVALDGTATVPEVTIGIEAGRTWHRVNQVTGERGSFEVETAVGTAAVRGTAFAVACARPPQGGPADVCTFTVFDGLVVVTTPDGQEIEVAAGEAVTLGLDEEDGGDGDGSGEVRGVVLTREEPGADAIARDPWVDANLPRDRATDRFGEAREACSVTVGGRNVAHATTPATALEVSIDESVPVEAVATGPLEDYEVRLRMAGFHMSAAEGTVQPDDEGDRTTFRGTVDVSDYARWGVGLYEVRGETTGTRCEVVAFVKVTGRHPLTTGAGIGALLLALVGAAGVGFAVARAVRGETLEPEPDRADKEGDGGSWWSRAVDTLRFRR